MGSYKKPDDCRADIYENGLPVVILSAQTLTAQGICDEMNRLLSDADRVDWHYVGGRAVFKTLGDVAICRSHFLRAFPGGYSLQC